MSVRLRLSQLFYQPHVASYNDVLPYGVRDLRLWVSH